MTRVLGRGSCVLGALALATTALAQSAGGVEPIRCWRQSSTGAVSIGEMFTVTLTCAVLETADTQVVPDESRLGVATIQLAPFEILGGSHPPDVGRDSRRFLQYDYQLRIISRDAIGQDVNVPAVTIAYRVRSRVGAAARLEGRDLSYLVPAMPIRVLSMVPADASDIRDSGDGSLAAVQALRTRSRTLQVLAYGLGALAAVMAVLALVPLARRARAAGRAAPLVPVGAMVTRAAAALAGTQQRAAGEGWTEDTLASALSAARVIAAAAVGVPVSQKPFTTGAPPDGRLLVEHGFPRRLRATVASAVTPADIARALAGTPGFTMTRAQQLDGLRASLGVLTAALYRQAPDREAPPLDEAVRQVLGVAREVAAERTWRRR